MSTPKMKKRNFNINGFCLAGGNSSLGLLGIGTGLGGNSNSI